ncbi:MAG: FecR domain-containing protein [Tannerellaceae bacterium]|nr:FecR domain-containing protein [Tannerellaceae bacterium]
MDKTLLQKYIEGKASREEVAQVTEWLDKDEKHVREFMAYHKLYDISLFNLPTVSPAAAPRKTRFPVRKIAYELIRIAALFLLAGTSLYFLSEWKTGKTPVAYQTVYVPSGQRAELILPDSTRIWLNARSRLTYPIEFGNKTREIRLDGEAYLHVRHNQEVPFLVHTDQLQIEVLGTEFNVSAYSSSSHAEVALLKGSIRLTSPLVSGSYLMQVPENVILENGQFRSAFLPDYDYFRWKEGVLSFTNEPVETLLKKLELYYDVRIDNTNRKLQESRYTGKFRTKDGVEQVLKVLQLEHRFTYTKDTESNLITIK